MALIKMSGTIRTLQDDLETLRLRWPELADALAPIDGLSAVLAWGAAAGLPVREMEIIMQDEYTHDATARRSQVVERLDRVKAKKHGGGAASPSATASATPATK